MQCNNCGRQVAHLSSLVAALPAADPTKLVKNIVNPQAPQGEKEVGGARITLVFVGSAEALANLFTNTDLFNADFRAPLFSIAEPTATANGKDEIPVGTFYGFDDIETAMHLLQMDHAAGFVKRLFNVDDQVAAFDPVLLAQLQTAGVVVMDAVNGDGGAALGANDVLVDDLVLKNGNLAAKNFGDSAWDKARDAMFGGNYLVDLLAGDNDAVGISAIDDYTGRPAAGPLAAKHGHVVVREDQAILA
jgi:hypothetical protein